MKKNLLLIFILALSFSASAKNLFNSLNPETLEIFASGKPSEEYVFPMTDPQYDWSTFKDKKGSAMIVKNGLQLECKQSNYFAASVVELPINTESESFLYGAIFAGPKLSDEVKVGIIFDYSDIRNYKGISISKDQFSYFIVKDGVSSTVKTGLIKYKGIFYTLVMTREADKVIFMLNGIEFAKLNKVKIENDTFGVMIEGKGKTLVPNFMFHRVPQEEDQEQSTSDV